MKKLLIWLLTAAFMFGGVCQARLAYDDNNDTPKKEKKEKKHKVKKEKKAKKEKKQKKEKTPKVKKEKKKKEPKVKKEKTPKVKKEKKAKKEKAPKVKKEKKKKEPRIKKEKAKKEKKTKKEKPAKIKKHKVKKEKKASVNKEERRKKREARKEERSFKKSKEGKKLAKQERHAKRAKNSIKDKERSERKNLKRQERKMRQQDKERRHKESRKDRAERLDDQERDKRAQKYDDVRAERKNRATSMVSWKKQYKVEAEADRKAGKYAHLYKSPAWPISALFYENKDLLNVSVNYKYATDSYGPNGGGSKSDVTRLAFGDKPIIVKEILLASKLIEAGKLVQDDDIAHIAGGNIQSDEYLSYLKNEKLNLNGRIEQYGMSFDLSRYIVNRDIAIGFEIPVLYKRHHLKLDMLLSDEAIKPDGASFNNGAFGPIGNVAANDENANAFLRRYGADPVRFAKDILRVKGITELGGSAMGLGDVAVFANAQIKSVYFDKVVLGLRAQFPTGKEASTSKLWAPDLGNGGFPEIAAFGSVLFSYAKYLNPHVLGQVSFSLPAHVDRRLPKKIAYTADAADNGVKVMSKFPQLAFSDRSAFTNPAVSFSEYDTTIKNFGDVVTDVRMTKGAEFKLRIGNMFERFISVSGFLDIFYDFRGKLKDKITNINTDLYNVDIMRDHSSELEHIIGFDYSYQWDLDTRLRLGARYTFAGMNVAKTFEAIGSLNYAF